MFSSASSAFGLSEAVLSSDAVFWPSGASEDSASANRDSRSSFVCGQTISMGSILRKETISLAGASQHSVIYLIANNDQLVDKHFNIIDDGICIHFNKAIHIDKTPQCNNQLVLNNYCASIGGYHGFEEYKQAYSKYTKLFLNTHSNQLISPHFKILINEISQYNQTDVFNSQNIRLNLFIDNLPSIGTISLFLISEAYHKTHNIVLIGFTGPYDDSKVNYGIKNGSGHPWVRERQLIKSLQTAGKIRAVYSTLAEIRAIL